MSRFQSNSAIVVETVIQEEEVHPPDSDHIVMFPDIHLWDEHTPNNLSPIVPLVTSRCLATDNGNEASNCACGHSSSLHMTHSSNYTSNDVAGFLSYFMYWQIFTHLIPLTTCLPTYHSI